MIITNNEELLRVKCENVTFEEYQNLKNTLEVELAYANKLGKSGIGLAAPQIGIAKNIAIIRLQNINLDLVNAKIANKYDKFIFKEEGCLSFPGRVENTTRYEEVHVVNNLVEPYSFVATGLLSVVIQHELDHLNSSLFFDSIAPIVKEVKLENIIKVGQNDPCFCRFWKKI